MQTLDPLALPLNGLHLIEASAGTGKTYTICTLYLRFLLGNLLGKEQNQPLQVDEILVVTFTQAATEELRDRIRRRIKDAYELLHQGHSNDIALTKLLQNCHNKQQALIQLNDALKRMDESAILTIHSFCQRILQESAFESRTLFDTELLTNESTLTQQIIEDFWRATFYSAPAELITFAQSTWKTPTGLWEKISPYAKHTNIKLLPTTPLTDLTGCLKKATLLFEPLQNIWHTEQELICDYLLHSTNLKRNIYNKNLPTYITNTTKYFSDFTTLLNPPEKFELFSITKIERSLKKGAQLPEHVFFKHCDEFIALIESIRTEIHLILLQQAIAYLKSEWAIRKQEKAQLTFDDLLSQLKNAITNADTGLALIKKIRAQYPAAMIDEFQDTDPLQYEIFKTLYSNSPENRPSNSTLLMIGDPKQAIYSFRGADIFTYIQAKQFINNPDNYHTLGTNWRSTHKMVHAINTLFEQSSSPFIYNEDIPFIAVEAAGESDKEPLIINNTPPVPVQFWQIESTNNKAVPANIAKKEIALSCASEIVRLLTQGDQNRAVIGKQPLQAQDIAILVRSHTEAQIMQNALQQYQIASVCLSRENVFNTPECNALYRVLFAIIEPSNERLLRAALCTPLLGFNADQLETMGHNDHAWENILLQIQQYHQSWLEHGFIVMFQQLLREYDIPARLLKQSDGERSLTNLLHLAELLQNTAATQPGMENLLRWLNLNRTHFDENEEQQLRLESDEALIKIITIHKSKGLEYPVVFLPFIWSTRSQNKNQTVIFHEPTNNQLHVDINSKDKEKHRELAKQEALAEQVRLLYVALTRAKYLCYIAWGKISGAEISALGYLLHGEPKDFNKLTDADIKNKLLALATDAIQVNQLPEPEKKLYHPITTTEQSTQARPFNSTINRQWRITSYSALTSSHTIQTEPSDQDTLPTEPFSSLFQFPKGAHTGVFLHSLLERLDFTNITKSSLNQSVIRQLTQYGFDLSWTPVIEKWLSNILNTPLNGVNDPPDTIKLKNIENRKKIVEMEFYFPLAPLDADQLNKLLMRNTNIKKALKFPTIQGVLKGFIDLIFEHNNKYYIVDYKSNHLGNQLQDYAKPQLNSSIEEHHYNLQYLIYTVALHRYLQQRLPDYCYNQHIGGVYYLFLRGMSPKNGNTTGVFHHKPPFSLIQSLDQLFTENKNKELTSC